MTKRVRRNAAALVVFTALYFVGVLCNPAQWAIADMLSTGPNDNGRMFDMGGYSVPVSSLPGH